MNGVPVDRGFTAEPLAVKQEDACGRDDDVVDVAFVVLLACAAIRQVVEQDIAMSTKQRERPCRSSLAFKACPPILDAPGRRFEESDVCAQEHAQEHAEPQEQEVVTLQSRNDEYWSGKDAVDQSGSSKNPLSPTIMDLAVLLARATTRAAVVRVEPVAHIELIGTALPLVDRRSRRPSLHVCSWNAACLPERRSPKAPSGAKASSE